jgi:hypothetical protein
MTRSGLVPEASRAYSVQENPHASRNCLVGSKNVGAGISISVRGQASSREALRTHGPSGDAANGPAMAELGIASSRIDCLQLVSESLELHTPRQNTANGIEAYQQSARAARPSPDLPLDPVG